MEKPLGFKLLILWVVALEGPEEETQMVNGAASSLEDLDLSPDFFLYRVVGAVCLFPIYMARLMVEMGFLKLFKR